MYRDYDPQSSYPICDQCYVSTMTLKGDYPEMRQRATASKPMSM